MLALKEKRQLASSWVEARNEGDRKNAPSRDTPQVAFSTSSRDPNCDSRTSAR